MRRAWHLLVVSGQVYCGPGCRQSGRSASHAMASRRDRRLCAVASTRADRGPTVSENGREPWNRWASDDHLPSGLEFLWQSDQALPERLRCLVGPLSRGVVVCIVRTSRPGHRLHRRRNRDRSRDGSTDTPSALRRHWRVGTIASELGLHHETSAALREGIKTLPTARPRQVDPMWSSCVRPWSSIRGCDRLVSFK
jgi:hypothetical protein